MIESLYWGSYQSGCTHPAGLLWHGGHPLNIKSELAIHYLELSEHWLGLNKYFKDSYLQEKERSSIKSNDSF